MEKYYLVAVDGDVINAAGEFFIWRQNFDVIRAGFVLHEALTYKIPSVARF